jgi:enoyl-CoA hydratase/carnithine racemase
MSNFGKMAEGPRTSGATSQEALTHRTHGIANRAQYAVWVWRQIPVPVIAAVHGVAFGGGFQLALGADMRFVAPDTRMAVLEIKWGLVPDMAGTLLMRHLAREDVVKELTYTGRVFSGEEALTMGFATRVCADPYAEALAVAREIAGKNPHAIRASKRLLNAAVVTDESTGMMQETVEQIDLIGSPNQIEAVMANMQKRAPAFND